MKNRNLVLFVVLSMALLLGYSYVVEKIYPTKAKTLPVAGAPAPQPAPESTKAVGPATTAPLPPAIVTAVPAPASLPSATHTLKLSSLQLTWRVEDGAIVQAEWTPDGTKFFTEEEKNPTGVEVSKPFPGIGGALGQTRFDQVFEEVTPSGVKVHFKNGIGDHLTYSVPKEGHAIEATWSTLRGAHLGLIPQPSDVKEAEHLGRVFTLTDKEIHAVAWTSVLKDPFFGFLGSKRSEMPPAASLLGMDAGLEKGVSGQRTHYFAALWDVSPRMTERDNQGYHLAPDKNGNLTARLYLGPKETNQLAIFGAPFTRVVDFGFFGAVAKLLFLVLHWIHRFIPNWGWSLIIFTVLLRALLWPLNICEQRALPLFLRDIYLRLISMEQLCW